MSGNQEHLLEHVDHLSALAKAKGFLGREFLNWLWFYIETHGNHVSLASTRHKTEYDLQLWVDDRMVFETFVGKSLVHTMRGGDPAKSLEAVAAFQSGKTLKELKLGFHLVGVGDFSAQLSCDGLKEDGLAPKGLQLPKADDKETSDAALETVLLRRLKHTEIFLDILDGLFARFMDERSFDSWEDKVMSKFKEWIHSKRANEILRGGAKGLVN